MREAFLASIQQKRAVLFELAGIHPLQEVTFEGLHETRDAPFAFVAEVDLLLHPAVMMKLAVFEATEQQLQIEIKKQWPEISLGPTVEHDGEWQGGLAFGMTLPLWNRNRAGIASAESLRAEARQECIDTWRSLVYASHQARGKIKALEKEREALRIAMQKWDEADASAHIEAAQAYYEFNMRFVEVEAEWQQARIYAEGEMLAVFATDATPR